MYLEARHLRTLLAIRNYQSLAAAAERLHLTQSALSHQLKALEAHFGTPLLQRKTRPPRFTPAGKRLLELAERFIPELERAERELKRINEGLSGRLHIAMECHSCFDWLMPTMDAYRQDWPEVEMDLSASFSFEALEALRRGDVDLVITADPEEDEQLEYLPLFRYQSLLAMSNDHPLAGKSFIEPQDLSGETLITYPVPHSRLDIFKHFLAPAGVTPARVRNSELSVMIMQLVASGRGVAAMPNWAIARDLERHYVKARPLGREGVWVTLYAGMRRDERSLAYMEAFVMLARQVSARTLQGIKTEG